MVAGAEGSTCTCRGAVWLHGHHRLCGDVYVNQGEEYGTALYRCTPVPVQYAILVHVLVRLFICGVTHVPVHVGTHDM